MMSTEVDMTPTAALNEEFDAYRAICPAAIASVLLGVLSPVSVLSMFLGHLGKDLAPQNLFSKGDLIFCALL